MAITIAGDLLIAVALTLDRNRSLFASTSRAQSSYWCCRRGRKEAMPAFKTGKEMRARLNRETGRQTDSAPALTNKGGGDPSLGSAFKCKEILTNHRSRYCRSTWGRVR
jgi:hypothetical protein